MVFKIREILTKIHVSKTIPGRRKSPYQLSFPLPRVQLFPRTSVPIGSRPPWPSLLVSTFSIRVRVWEHKHGRLLFSTCALGVQLIPGGCSRQEFLWPRDPSDPSSRTAFQLMDSQCCPAWPHFSPSVLLQGAGGYLSLVRLCTISVI